VKESWAVRFILAGGAYVQADAVIDGAEVTVSKGAREFDVVGVIADSQEHAISTARFLANMFLNKLSWRHGHHLEIAYPVRTSRNLASGQEDVQCIEPPVVYAASIELRILDAAGNVVADSTKLGKIEVGRSEAAPYYRRAHLSNDPFDKFRNFYLAVENVSSSLRVKVNRSSLKEQRLLEAALTECFRGREDSLTQAAKGTAGLDLNKPVAQEVSKVLYKGHRCQLNHSKALQDKKIPFDPQDEEDVQSVLPLVDFVAKCLLEYEEASHSGGGGTGSF
jgi:hypothetical protein